MKKIEITTKRLQLKPLGMEYFQTVNEYARDVENTTYMCHLPNENEEETAEFLRNIDLEWQKEYPDFFEFAILYENQHIGAVSIHLENGIGELGWIVNKKYWKNGFAYEAAEALIQYFTEKMGIMHFIAHCDMQNTASYKVMEKIGMIKTGEWGGRKNRASLQESFEYQYELMISK